MELSRSRLHVVVLESGAESGQSPLPDSLNRVENIGAPRQEDQTRVRNRCFGGTSATWSGRCIGLDEIDFEARSWMERSGWPIHFSTLKPFLCRTSPYLGLKAPCQAAGATDTNSSEVIAIQGALGLRPLTWQFSRTGDSILTEDYTRFGAFFNRIPHTERENIDVWTRATVTHINVNENGTRVTSLEVADAHGRVIEVRASVTILCAGAIENARVLLSSNRWNKNGLGNHSGAVGRFFMDHPRAVVGSFQPSDVSVVQRKYGILRDNTGNRTQRGWSIASQLQRQEHLLNCSSWVTQHLAHDDVWRALRGLVRPYGRTRSEASAVAIKNVDQIVVGSWRKIVQRRPLPRRWGQLNLEVMVEQEPNQQSRVALANRTDAFGMPLARIDWKIGALEGQTAIRLAERIAWFFERSEGIRPTLAEWVSANRPQDAIFSDAAHPSGTTRMSRHPNDGVVDGDCKVFFMENLYVLGSSVFPTAGHANPTLTIVALAIRLADHLKTLTLRKHDLETISSGAPTGPRFTPRRSSYRP
jgi:choline dehydrogenase-like flavoprotein